MKRIFAVMAFAFALTLPFMDSDVADRNYMVAKSSTNIWNHTYEKGNARCTDEIGEEMFRSWGLNWPRWNYVSLQHRSLTD